MIVDNPKQSHDLRRGRGGSKIKSGEGERITDHVPAGGHYIMLAIFAPLNFTQSGPLSPRTLLEIEGPTCRLLPVAVNKAKECQRLRRSLKKIRGVSSSISSDSFFAVLV